MELKLKPGQKKEISECRMEIARTEKTLHSLVDEFSVNVAFDERNILTSQ